MPPSLISSRPKVSFIRHYYGYTGGHQKVRDYIQHFIDLGWDVELYLEGESPTEPELFQDIEGVHYQTEYSPHDADLVFLAGMDWEHFLALGIKDKLVLNLIQHVRHANPEEHLHKFLQHKATRICVSKSVERAIAPFAQGSVTTIKMGHSINAKPSSRVNDVYILANKQAEMGNELAEELTTRGYRVICHDDYVDKSKVINAMASSTVTVTLPHKTEGFYLPGIEAMALSDVAVVPNCIASVEYTEGFNNAIRCELHINAIRIAVDNALNRSNSKLLWLRKFFGRRVAAEYSLQKEKRNLNKLLKKLII